MVHRCTDETAPAAFLPPGRFVVRGSSSGQGRGGYIPETSVRTWLSAPSVTSGPAAASTATDPCRQPRDWAPKQPTGRNITAPPLHRQFVALSLNMMDWARREHPS